MRGQLMNRKDLKSNISQDYQQQNNNSFFSPVNPKKEMLIDYNFKKRKQSEQKKYNYQQEGNIQDLRGVSGKSLPQPTQVKD